MENRICLNCKNFETEIGANGENIYVCKEGRKINSAEDYCNLFEEGVNTGFLKEAYYTIVDILKEYCDLDERYYPIVALWILGTYAHSEFNTYPYLFLNAMRQSGKSRLLRLISILSKNGKMVGSLTEAVLFRTAKGKTFCIDEFEGVGKKDKSNLRELLNSAYKKGVTIERADKKDKDGNRIVEEFDVYTSIAMANIWGMEEVLGDRCITLTLEKSNKKKITKLVENYDNHYSINKIKKLLNNKQLLFSNIIKGQDISSKWNKFIKNNYTNTPNTLTTQTTLTTQEQTLFNKINNLEIDGRDLELFFSLFLVADLIDEVTLDRILEIAKTITKEKRTEELTESKDILLINFLAEKSTQEDLRYHDFINVSALTNDFREHIGAETDDQYINSKWVGRALKRLNLIINKRRVARGVEITLNIEKAKAKSPLFSV